MSLNNHKWAETRAEVIALLRAYDVTPTQQRIEIGQLLFQGPQHVSAEQVLSRVNGANGNVSKATVYNTLGLFAEKGLIREVVVDPNKLFYDTNLEPHHHFFHVKTGRLEDIDSTRISLGALPECPPGMDIEGVDIIIRLKDRAD